jgi:Putative Ig domain
VNGIRFLLAAIVASLAFVTGTDTASAATPGRLTVIADSVMTGVVWNPPVLSVLESGWSDVDLQVGICRVLTGESCPFGDQHVPNLLEVVSSLGNQIGETVVVEVGYNDPAATFASAFQQSVQALLAAGVTRIFWVNYHVWQPQYATMDDTLSRLAKAYPQVTIVDWETTSAEQYHWFQSDGIHLVYDGAVALATLIHDTMVETLNPLTVTSEPVQHVRVGRRFSLHLAVTGGIAPYEWRVTRRALPRGLHLLAGGVLDGAPAKPGRTVVNLQVTDAAGTTARLSLDLVSAASRSASSS